MRTRVGTAALVIGGCVLLTPTAAAGNAGPSGAPRAAQTAGGDLFVQTAGGGTFMRVPGRRGVFRLVLTSAHRTVARFSDRPQRRAGSESLAAFVRRWRSRGFVSDPPNAALVVAGARKRQDVIILELRRPRRGQGSVRYLARVVKGASTQGLRRFASRADSRVAGRFGQASLFIDSSAVGAFPDVRLKVSVPRTPITGAPGQDPLTFGLFSPAGPAGEIDMAQPSPVRVTSQGPVSFTLADGGSGFLITSPGGTSAVVELLVTPLRDPMVGTVIGTFSSMVTIQTPSGAIFPVNPNTGRYSIPLDAATSG